ncbi:hypothetical protein MKZ38_009624 [Zalerion maritima]|uniref:Clr5 domain-containing protein n=1 Tax=Zalerion maritima TaxID=339359 RepID=A0AAD5WUK4_9PEZI|nr:hypothetical protein MKZ38_009624 [Zalerion maritima]
MPSQSIEKETHLVLGGRIKKHSSKTVGESQRPKASRASRVDETTWERWHPRLIELYLVYDLHTTQQTLAKEGFQTTDGKPINHRQVRHQIERLGLDKYQKSGDATASRDAHLRRGRKRAEGEKEIPVSTQIELAQFWLALAAEKKAYPLLALHYATCVRNEEGDRATRAAIAQARTSQHPSQKKASRRNLIRQAFQEPTKNCPDYHGIMSRQQDAASISRGHVFSAYHAYTYGRGDDTDEKADKKAEKKTESEAKRAAQALKHLFGPEAEEVEPKFSDKPLGSHLDILSYFGTWYALSAAEQENVIRDSPFSDHKRDQIRGKCLDTQPAIMEMTRGKKRVSTPVVRNCLLWISKAIQEGNIVIPQSLKEVSTDECQAWRDEMELVVAVWYHHLQLKNHSGDGWSDECEEHLSIYPAELIALILRRVMEEVPASRRDGHPFLTLEPDDSVSNRGSPTSGRFLSPAPGNTRGSLSHFTPVPRPNSPNGRHQPSNASCTATIERRERLVVALGQSILNLLNESEKTLWERLLDWFVDMNRLDTLTHEDCQFKQEMVDAIDDWVKQEVKRQVPSSMASAPLTPVFASSPPPNQPTGPLRGTSRLSDMSDDELWSRDEILLISKSDQGDDTNTDEYEMDIDEKEDVNYAFTWD